MRPSQARFVTATQQLLALGVVLVVLAPAAGVATLDVVDRFPGGASGASGAGGPGGAGGEVRVAPGSASYDPDAERAEVETAPVEADLVEHRLTTRTGAAGPSARSGRESLTSGEVLSVAEPVSGYGAVGVTWDSADAYGEDDIAVTVRTRTDGGRWTGWEELEYHDEHAPDPDSAEARTARPGTEPVFVGEVDEVQVRTRTPGTAAPRDLRLAVIGPGESAGTELAAPEYAGSDAGPGAEAVTSSEGDLALQAAGAARPTIFSRQQWGADERLRSGSPSYGTIKGGFVHHTVNANDYSREQVPGMLRSIYAYHTRSRGWSDVGYNFLVDKFGRIWEGRYGGVTRPVIGAHTLGYNHESFAASAIGNFDIASPPEAVVKAYGRLMGWKLGLHGINAAATSVTIAGRRFAAINGHRDAGSTACPGRFLYAKLPQIRSLARAAQTSTGEPTPPTPTPDPEPPAPTVSGTPTLDSDLLGTPHPDLVARRGRDGRLLVVPTAGGTQLVEPRALTGTWPSAARLVATHDVTGDSRADLLALTPDGRGAIHPGDGAGGFGAAVRTVSGFSGMSLVVSAGDLNGDGRSDLVGRLDGSGRLVAFLGTARGGFVRSQVGTGWGTYPLVAGAGDLDGDGYDDLVGRDREGRLFVHRGLAPADGRSARLAKRVQLAGSFGTVNAVLGVGDADRDGSPDLLVRRDGGDAYLHPVGRDLALGPAYGPISGLGGLTAMTSGPDLTGDGWPDVLARKGGRPVLVAHRGTTETERPRVTDVDATGANRIMSAGDVDGDGHGDLVLRQGSGALLLHRGDGAGGFAARVRIGTGFGDVTGLQPVGDVTGDGRADLLGTRAGKHWVWPSGGTGALGAPLAAPASLVAAVRPSGIDLSGYDWWVAISDLNLVGKPDLVLAERSGKLLWSRNRRADDSHDPRRLLTRWSGTWNLIG